MQSISWYINRLKTMSVSEIIWRVTSLAKSLFEAARVSTGIVASPRYRSGLNAEKFSPAFRLSAIAPGEWVTLTSDTNVNHWLSALKIKADLASQNSLSYFNLNNHHHGVPFEWNRDHFSNINSPVIGIMNVDYRDFKNFGDCKLVWEPNRHHHLVVLARAYRATGDLKYANAVIEQMNSWLHSNPYGYGMNWRSPLELGIRLINWTWAIDLIWESGLVVGDFKRELLRSVYLHCRDIAGKFSQGTSANNHLIGEAAGVFVAASYFDVFQECPGWIAKSHAILQREIIAQSFADGCTKEHALGYQFFVIQFYLYSGLIAEKSRNRFAKEYWERLNSMIEFVARIAEGGDKPLPMFGDRDDGYVLDLGDPVDDVVALCTVAALTFDKASCGSSVNHIDFEPALVESGAWLFGIEPLKRDIARFRTTKNIKLLKSTAFSQSGYYLLQGGGSDHICASLLIDCAELGYTNIAAHGHADALGFAMRLHGIDLFVDTGTYDYFTYPEWRNYFRKTRAHNALEIDGLDQSEMQGPFMWGQHAKANCIRWEPNNEGGIFEGEHSGYIRLSDPVTHKRNFMLDCSTNSLVIKDQVQCKSAHVVTIYFHLSEFVDVLDVNVDGCIMKLGDIRIELLFDSRMKFSMVKGENAPIGGWLSRGYHQKTPINTLIATAEITGTTEFTSKLVWTKML